jgi:hypothetical protein
MSLFSKKQKPVATTVDPNADPKLLEPKLGADGKPLPGQDIDPATGKLKKVLDRANDPNNMDDPNKSKDPLAIFDGMWDTKAKTGQENPVPAFSLDPEALKKVTEQLQFSPQLTPELLAKFKEGDPETLTGLLNSVGRQAYSMLMSHIPTLTDKYVSARLEHDRAGLGREVRQSLTANSLETIASKNPVLKQQIDRVVEAIYDKYPDATPDWVSGQVKKYFTGIAQLMDPDAFKGATAGNADEPNLVGGESDKSWLDYLSRDHKK